MTFFGESKVTDWLKRDAHVPFDLLPQPTPPRYVAVTPEMMEAGVNALLRHSFRDDQRDIVSSVYRAMELARKAD